MHTEGELHTVLEQLRSANDRMMQGESGPWKQLLSARDDVVLLGAFGGYIHDRAEVNARYDRTASAYAGGHASYEALGTWVGSDLACTVGLEWHHEQYLAGRGPMTITYRVTHVFRREPEGWKVVLRHADPLAEFRGPELVFPPPPR
ncbi:MAG: YybH family protein [Chloroflexota bacterium]